MNRIFMTFLKYNYLVGMKHNLNNEDFDFVETFMKKP